MYGKNSAGTSREPDGRVAFDYRSQLGHRRSQPGEGSKDTGITMAL
jgi:hypothetical protein